MSRFVLLFIVGGVPGSIHDEGIRYPRLHKVIFLRIAWTTKSHISPLNVIDPALWKPLLDVVFVVGS